MVINDQDHIIIIITFDNYFFRVERRRIGALISTSSSSDELSDDI